MGQCDSSIFEKVVWSEPNISQIEAGSSTIYAWYQEFEFFFFQFQTKKIYKQNCQKLSKIKLNLPFKIYKFINFKY
jgi:hypothetical protein